MAIEQVKTINELERLSEISDDNAFAVSAGNATGSTTAKMIETYLEQYLEKLTNKVNQITPEATDEQYPSAKAAYDVLATVNSVKPGTIIVWSTSTAPEGYLICDGSAVSRTTYAALFAVIGTTYGEGDGNSTFNLPSLALEDSIIYSSATDDSFQLNFASGKTLVLGSQVNTAQYTAVTFPQKFTSTRYTALGNYQGNTYPDTGAARTSYLNTVQRTDTSMQIGSYNAGAGYVTYLAAGNLARGAYVQSKIIKCIKY